MGDRIGTHSPNCWSFGPKHYDCATRRVAELEAKLATAVWALELINAGAVDGLDLARDSMVLERAIKVANRALASIQERP